MLINMVINIFLNNMLMNITEGEPGKEVGQEPVLRVLHSQSILESYLVWSCKNWIRSEIMDKLLWVFLTNSHRPNIFPICALCECVFETTSPPSPPQKSHLTTPPPHPKKVEGCQWPWG